MEDKHSMLLILNLMLLTVLDIFEKRLILLVRDQDSDIGQGKGHSDRDKKKGSF